MKSVTHHVTNKMKNKTESLKGRIPLNIPDQVFTNIAAGWLSTSCSRSPFGDTQNILNTQVRSIWRDVKHVDKIKICAWAYVSRTYTLLLPRFIVPPSRVCGPFKSTSYELNYFTCMSIECGACLNILYRNLNNLSCAYLSIRDPRNIDLGLVRPLPIIISFSPSHQVSGGVVGWLNHNFIRLGFPSARHLSLLPVTRQSCFNLSTKSLLRGVLKRGFN